jgi:multicomponent Na+:H+ antiporter subunit E
VSYLIFTAGSGADILFWQTEEIIAGAIISIFFSIMAHRIIPRKITISTFNPLKWIGGFLFLIGPFALTMVLANFEVLYRIITGRIRPAIVKVKPEFDSEAGLFLLANTITLSPGTLTVDLDPETNELYIHSLNWKKEPGEKAEPSDVSGMLHYFLKKVFR